MTKADGDVHKDNKYLVIADRVKFNTIFRMIIVVLMESYSYEKKMVLEKIIKPSELL